VTEAAASNTPGSRVGGFAVRGPARLLSDERLAQRAASGDRRAFEEIFRRYHQDLYRFCLATAGDPQDAQDALQNTMVKVMRALPGEDRQIKLKPWLYRIARNEAVETVRKRRDSAELESARAPVNWEIAETAEARERLRGLFVDLAELPERQRVVLVLRELAGLGFEEIAESFGTTPSVARQTLYEARLNLRQMEAGREMRCEAVTRALSDADGRVIRRRDLRAHLRDCASCRSFSDGIATRRGDFAAIAPLPLAASAGLLQGLLSGQVGTAGAAAGKAIATSTIATSTIAKSAATVAVVAAVGVSAADRSGLIDVPLPGNGEAASEAPTLSPAVPQSAEGAGPTELGLEGAQSSGTSAVPSGAGEKKGSAGIGHRTDNSARRSEGQSHHSQGALPEQARAPSARGNSRGEGEQQQQSLPPASNHGQETAAAHKPPQAQSSPGHGKSAKATPGPPSAPPSKSNGSENAHGPPETTPAEPPAGTKGQGASKGQGPPSAEPPQP
jgi:RNA polymerase sigma factor (sigma-70 family)